MKKIFFTYLLPTMLLLASNVVFADLTCPPEDQVKSVKLIQAYQHPYDPDCWYLISASFMHDDNAWSVSLGTFFPGVTTEEEALEQGQAYFDQAAIVNKNPIPVAIPNKILCEYIPNGRSYWISAVTPPDAVTSSL